MGTDILTIIKESFEDWYNRNISKDCPVTIAINYSDTQTFAIKAFHHIQMEVRTIGIKNNKAFCTAILMLAENYNHGVTTEEEAKEGLIRKLLTNLYSYKEQ